jgi:multidrug/hemolysin transport system permease protein
MVEDKSKKIIKDIRSSPIPRASIAGGYILSAFIIGMVMCLVTLVLAELYILSNGGALIGAAALLKVLGLLLLSTFSNTALVLFLVSFFQSNNAFATASTIIGTMIGFLTGIYLPIGQLPSAVQWVIRVFPPSHSAVLLRQVIMTEPLAQTFAGVPAEYLEGFKETMGIVFKFGDTTVTPLMSMGILALSGLVFLGLSILSLSRKKK